MAPSVELLLREYPGYVMVDDFPVQEVADKVGNQNTLYLKVVLVFLDKIRKKCKRIV